MLANTFAARSVIARNVPYACSVGAPHAHAAAPRYARRTRIVQATLCHGRAGVRECALQHAARSLHAARPDESERPVAALLLGTQHRKVYARGVCGVTHEAGGARAISRNTCIARIAPRYRLSMSSRVNARCFARCRVFTGGAWRLFLQPQRRVLLQGPSLGCHQRARWQSVKALSTASQD